jgi:hypothetical protein
MATWRRSALFYRSWRVCRAKQEQFNCEFCAFRRLRVFDDHTGYAACAIPARAIWPREQLLSLMLLSSGHGRWRTEMSAKTVTVMAGAVLVGGTLLASAANAASAAQITATSADHNIIYFAHRNSAAINAEHNVYAGHKASAAAPYGYNDAPGGHALGGGPG